MDNFEVDDLIVNEYKKEYDFATKNEINRLISSLQLYSNDIENLTRVYTNILNDDNVVYLLTKISQNQIFMEHFPEFYQKNLNGESVINCQQNSPYHRYGVFKHILYTIENVGKDNLKFSSYDMKILKWTMFLHDIGKPMAKTTNSEGKDSFAGHDEISVELADRVLERFDFDENDKKIILTLIKYHDKYLNEGDLTYDNLSFLAKELENKKELFYLLIEVKLADNKAKSVDVHNKFMTVVGKYYDFANEYFLNANDNILFDKVEEDESIITSQENTVTTNSVNSSENSVYIEGGNDSEITEEHMTQIVKDITAGRKFKCYYQPVIDLQKSEINGYEAYYKIITEQDFSYKQIMRKARELGKYDKLQQMLFVNALEKFNELKGKRDVVEYLNIDAKSYQKYVNKARIFDLIEKNKVVLEFNNFETLINSKIKELSDEMFKMKGNVAIDNFESSNKVLKDLEQISPKYVKYKIKNLEENTKQELKELSTFCMLNGIVLIVFGVDSNEKLEYIKECGVRYVQGDLFGKPTENLLHSYSEQAFSNQDAQEELIV